MSCNHVSCGIWDECDQLLGSELKPFCAESKQIPSDVERFIIEWDNYKDYSVIRYERLIEYIKEIK